MCVTTCIIIHAIGCGNNETLKQREGQEKKGENCILQISHIMLINLTVC